MSQEPFRFNTNEYIELAESTPQGSFMNLTNESKAFYEKEVTKMEMLLN